MTVMNHTAEDCRNEQKTVSSGTRNLLIFLALAVLVCVYYAWPGIQNGASVSEYYEYFTGTFMHHFGTAFGPAVHFRGETGFSVLASIGWCLRFIPACLAVMFVSELGTPRNLHSDGDNSAANAVIEIFKGFGALLLVLTGKLLKFLFRSIFVFLFASIFAGAIGLMLAMKVFVFVQDHLAVPLVLLACAAVKYAAALPLTDRIVQKTGLVRRSVYAPMALISAALNGVCLLYYRYLDNILQGLHLMNSVSAPAYFIAMVLMHMPILLTLYFTMRGAVEYGRK